MSLLRIRADEWRRTDRFSMQGADPSRMVCTHRTQLKMDSAHSTAIKTGRAYMLSRNTAFLLCFIVAATGLHLGIVAACANPIPFSDEWIAVVDDVLRPAATGQLSPWDLFRSHNEHTMVPTRLLALVALWLNHGQFDNVPVALFNALLYAGAMAVPIFLFFRHAAGPTRLFAIVLALAALVPIEGEDLIFGFQNQYYFMIAGTTGLLWLAAKSTSTAKLPLAAFAIVGFITCVSMGSGFFAAAMAVFICALRWWREPQHRSALQLRMLVGGVLAVFGLVLVLHAFVVMKEVGILGDKHLDLDVIRRVFSCMAWPYGANAWLGVLLSLPFAAFTLHLLWRRASIAPLDYLAIGMGLWTGAQICALAFDRHSEATTLASRYLPVMLLWPAMNVYAVFRLVIANVDGNPSRWKTAVLSLLPALASAAFIVNVAKLAPSSLTAVTLAGQQHQMQAEHIARYVRLGDRNAIYGAGHMGIPYSNPQKLQSLLDDPAVRGGLPANVRAPLALAPDGVTAFVPFGAYPSVPRQDDLPGFGSYAETGNPTVGEFRSSPLYTDFPYVRIDLAGYLPDTGLSLALDCVPAAPCRPTAVYPADFARESWRGIYARVPQPQFRVAANDATQTLWQAFSAPVEVGRLSVMSDALVNKLRADAHVWIPLAGGLLSLLFLIGAWRESPPSPLDGN
jgi:hypothetical protein